jgi:hypothetical protein
MDIWITRGYVDAWTCFWKREITCICGLPLGTLMHGHGSEKERLHIAYGHTFPGSRLLQGRWRRLHAHVPRGRLGERSARNRLRVEVPTRAL